MSKALSQPTRRQVLVSTASGITAIAIWPATARSGASISLKVISLSPFADVVVDIPVATLLRGVARFIPIVGAGLVLYGAYKIGKRIWDAVSDVEEPSRRSGDRRQYEESAGEVPTSGNSYIAAGVGTSSRPLPEPVIIVINVDEAVNGEVLRIRTAKTNLIDADDNINLGSGGSLHVEEDGKMRFVDSPFDGYALLDRLGKLTVWNSREEIVLIIFRHERDLVVLRSDTPESLLALQSLVGDRHAP